VHTSDTIPAGISLICLFWRIRCLAAKAVLHG